MEPLYPSCASERDHVGYTIVSWLCEARTLTMQLFFFSDNQPFCRYRAAGIPQALDLVYCLILWCLLAASACYVDCCRTWVLARRAQQCELMALVTTPLTGSWNSFLTNHSPCPFHTSSYLYGHFYSFGTFYLSLYAHAYVHHHSIQRGGWANDSGLKSGTQATRLALPSPAARPHSRTPRTSSSCRRLLFSPWDLHCWFRN
jgi:hypothetical protein